MQNANLYDTVNDVAEGNPVYRFSHRVNLKASGTRLVFEGTNINPDGTSLKLEGINLKTTGANIKLDGFRLMTVGTNLMVCRYQLKGGRHQHEADQHRLKV
jgi:hypothetical protein